jgi:membrane fusion protein, multidrug efflux system
MIRLASLVALAITAAPPDAPRVASSAPPAANGPAKVHAVRSGAPAGTALVPASAVAARRATISTRVAAAVRDVHAREGQRVLAGQLLVSLADSDVRGGVAAAESGLAAASAHERRIRALAAERAATASELEQAQAQRAQAEAAVATARATLAYTELRAPFAGTVQARRIDPGDLVGPGQPLLELEGDAIELVATLSEAEARGLSVGAALPWEAGAVRGLAVVTALTPGGDALSHRRTVRARVSSSDGGELRTGAFARLLVPADAAASPGGLWIPRSALVERGDLTGVFVASAGRAELRWLALGERAGELVNVRAGLRPEDVVVDVPGALRDGQAVEVLP